MASSDVNFLQFSGADTFLDFYIKRRIEHDGKLEWMEAPYCCEEDPPSEWMVVEEAAVLFEKENRQQIAKIVQELDGIWSFRRFRSNVLNFLDGLKQNRLSTILALIAFTGFYARKLAEMEMAQEDFGQDDWRNFRWEIHELSLFSARLLLTKLEGKWVSFCMEIKGLMDRKGVEIARGTNHFRLLDFAIAIFGWIRRFFSSCIPPQAYGRLGVDMAQFPIIERIDRYQAEIAEFKPADALHQPETPPDQKK